MHIAVPHKVSKEQAITRIQKSLEENRAQIAQHAAITEEQWNDNILTFAVDLQGKTITGTLEVTDTEYVIDAKLPLLWRMFEGTIESKIAEQVKNMN